MNAESPFSESREAESSDEARVKLVNACVKTQPYQVRSSSYSSHVSAMAILFAYNALSFDRPVSVEGSMDEVERDAHYANE